MNQQPEAAPRVGALLPTVAGALFGALVSSVPFGCLGLLLADKLFPRCLGDAVFPISFGTGGVLGALAGGWVAYRITRLRQELAGRSSKPR